MGFWQTLFHTEGRALSAFLDSLLLAVRHTMLSSSVNFKEPIAFY
jgi:hypothetical protein